MVLTATIYTFSIQLSDVDRAVYEALALKVGKRSINRVLPRLG
jgi:uncharacterized protein YaeQ